MTGFKMTLGAFAALILLGGAPHALADDEAAEQAARRAKALEKYDTDGNGELSEAERKAARKAVRLERWDTDGDGELSDAEREAGQAKRDRKRAEILDKYDEDGNGRLNEAELRAAREGGAFDR